MYKLREAIYMQCIEAGAVSPSKALRISRIAEMIQKNRLCHLTTLTPTNSVSAALTSSLNTFGQRDSPIKRIFGAGMVWADKNKKSIVNSNVHAYRKKPKRSRYDTHTGKPRVQNASKKRKRTVSPTSSSGSSDAVSVRIDTLEQWKPWSSMLSVAEYSAMGTAKEKYNIYGDAFRRFYRDSSSGVMHIVVVGAGAGGLIDAAITAVPELNLSTVTAIDINKVAVGELVKKYSGSGMRIIHGDGTKKTLFSDMANVGLSEPDLVLSELLGSCGDNEGAPEILHSVMKHIKRYWPESSPKSIPAMLTILAQPAFMDGLPILSNRLQILPSPPFNPTDLHGKWQKIQSYALGFDSPPSQQLWNVTIPSDVSGIAGYKNRKSKDSNPNVVLMSFECECYSGINMLGNAFVGQDNATTEWHLAALAIHGRTTKLSSVAIMREFVTARREFEYSAVYQY